MQNLTYQDLINVLQTFANSHTQINSFFSGEMDDFQVQQNYYIAMIVLATKATIRSGETILSFSLIVTDLLNETTYNLDQALSNTLLIMQDIFSYLNNNPGDLNYEILDEGFTCEPFQEKYTDSLVGWIANIDISIPFMHTSIPGLGNGC